MSERIEALQELTEEEIAKLIGEATINVINRRAPVHATSGFTDWWEDTPDNYGVAVLDILATYGYEVCRKATCVPECDRIKRHYCHNCVEMVCGCHGGEACKGID
jgi:hypothetical protein